MKRIQLAILGVVLLMMTGGVFAAEGTRNETNTNAIYRVTAGCANPGTYPWSVGITLLKAVAAAGGYSEFANPMAVIKRRPRLGDKLIETTSFLALPYEIHAIERGAQKDPEILSDDEILVREKKK